MPLASSTELFERYGAAIYRRCKAMLGDESSASDAVQEVFLKAHLQRASFRGEASPFTWLYSIATTHCLQQMRNSKRRAGKLASLGKEDPPPAPGAPDERLRTMALLESFPLDVQQIAYLRHVDGLDIEEVARATHLSTKTVSRKLQDFAERSREMAAREGAEVRS
jgi:RNA polymerase sigma-70 factor (ECF subfamily)